MSEYIDLRITDNDLTLDASGEPQLLGDRDCITQDIQHLIRDSGLMVEIVGQRDHVTVEDLMLRLTLLIETDIRLVPGSILITQTESGEFFVQATTDAFEQIEMQVSA